MDVQGCVSETYAKIVKCFTILQLYNTMKHTSDRTVFTSMHHGKVHNLPKFRKITGVREKTVLPHGRDDVAPINMLRRRLLSLDGEPVAGSGDGPRVAGDWEQWVDGLVNRLVGTACVWFPRVYGEGRRLKGSAKKPCPGRRAYP